MSLEDDFNPSWIIYRLFGWTRFSPEKFSITNYEHLKNVHDSLPCGLGGVHLSASTLFAEKDLAELRSRILKDFSVTVHLNNELILMLPIITYDLPEVGGINHDVIVRKLGACCNDFQNLVRANFVFGPNLDYTHNSDVTGNSSVYRNLLKAAHVPIFVTKHFGLEDWDEHQIEGASNPHWGRVVVDRNEESLTDEWAKLTSISSKSSLRGIMVSHAFIADDSPSVPLTNSHRITNYQAEDKNIFSVSDSLDMTLTYGGIHYDLPITTDFILWVNFYSSLDYLSRFLNKDQGPHVDKVLDVKVREKLLTRASTDG